MRSMCEIGEAYLWFAVVGHFLLYVVASAIGTMLAFQVQDWWDG